MPDSAWGTPRVFNLGPVPKKSFQHYCTRPSGINDHPLIIDSFQILIHLRNKTFLSPSCVDHSGLAESPNMPVDTEIYQFNFG